MTDDELDGRSIGGGTAELRLSRTLDARRERVWMAWTDQEQVAQWWGPNGFTNTIHEMDVRSGGVWRLVMHGPDGVDHHNEFTYDEIVEPERLVYTHPPNEENDFLRFQVVVTLDERGGGTDLTFRMRFESATERERLEDLGGVEPANQTLDRLAQFLVDGGRSGLA